MPDVLSLEPRLRGASSADLTALTSRVTMTETEIAALQAASPSVPETAGSALAIGTSVQRILGGMNAGRMLAEDGSYQALKDGFAGFTITVAAANGDPVTVAGNGGIATGLTGIVKGTGYYVSAGVLIAESGIDAFVAGAASSTCYRFVGTGVSTTSLKQAWGEPQLVP